MNTRIHEVTVIRRALEAEDVVVLDLGGQRQLPRWRPGAHIDVRMPSGRLRQYSLCGDTSAAEYRIAVRLVPGGLGGSREIHQDIRVGDRLRISEPRNGFPLVVGPGNLQPPHVRFVAGGIGITPILPMVAAADRYGLDWSLIYLGASAGSMAFLADLRRYGPRVRLRLDDESGLPSGLDVLGDLCDGAEVYCCGPGPLLEMLRGYAQARGTVGFHCERFASPPIVQGEDFQIELGSDGTVIDVAADQSALDAIRAVRPDALYSCRQGFCGTCRVIVLAGDPIHHGIALTPAERQRQMLPCVSRAAGGRIVVDL